MARGSPRAEGCSSERAGVPLRLVSDPAEGRTSVAELVEGVGKGGRQGSAGGGGGRLTTGFWRPPQAPGSSPGGYWGPGQRVREGLTTGFWPRVVRGGGRAVQEGGGGASPQAFGDPPRRRAPHQEVIGARASLCARASPQAFGPALSGGARRGAVQAGSPRGWLSCAWPQASRGCFLWGSCRFMAQGAWGRVPTLAPGGSCWLSLGGGGMRFGVFWEASYLPWQKPGGLFALGNLRCTLPLVRGVPRLPPSPCFPPCHPGG